MLATADDEDGVLVIAAEVADEFPSTPPSTLTFAVDDEEFPPTREELGPAGSNDFGRLSSLLVGDGSASKSDGGLERSGDELLVANVVGEIIVDNYPSPPQVVSIVIIQTPPSVTTNQSY